MASPSVILVTDIKQTANLHFIFHLCHFDLARQRIKMFLMCKSLTWCMEIIMTGANLRIIIPKFLNMCILYPSHLICFSGMHTKSHPECDASPCLLSSNTHTLNQISLSFQSLTTLRRPWLGQLIVKKFSSQCLHESWLSTFYIPNATFLMFSSSDFPEVSSHSVMTSGLCVVKESMFQCRTKI